MFKWYVLDTVALRKAEAHAKGNGADMCRLAYGCDVQNSATEKGMVGRQRGGGQQKPDVTLHCILHTHVGATPPRCPRS